MGLWFVLAPVRKATDALLQYRENRHVPQLPSRHLDQAGRLMAGVVMLARKTDRLTRDLEHAALVDPLTGLANRRGFEATTPAELANEIGDGKAVFVGVIDLDMFKTINDTSATLQEIRCCKRRPS
jgi:predicted signal transduction protein with EAL and GGDEF domain